MNPDGTFYCLWVPLDSSFDVTLLEERLSLLAPSYTKICHSDSAISYKFYDYNIYKYIHKFDDVIVPYAKVSYGVMRQNKCYSYYNLLITKSILKDMQKVSVACLEIQSLGQMNSKYTRFSNENFVTDNLYLEYKRCKSFKDWTQIVLVLVSYDESRDDYYCPNTKMLGMKCPVFDMLAFVLPCDKDLSFSDWAQGYIFIYSEDGISYSRPGPSRQNAKLEKVLKNVLPLASKLNGSFVANSVPKSVYA